MKGGRGGTAFRLDSLPLVLLREGRSSSMSARSYNLTSSPLVVVVLLRVGWGTGSSKVSSESEKEMSIGEVGGTADCWSADNLSRSGNSMYSEK